MNDTDRRVLLALDGTEGTPTAGRKTAQVARAAKLTRQRAHESLCTLWMDGWVERRLGGIRGRTNHGWGLRKAGGELVRALVEPRGWRHPLCTCRSKR